MDGSLSVARKYSLEKRAEKNGSHSSGIQAPLNLWHGPENVARRWVGVGGHNGGRGGENKEVGRREPSRSTHSARGEKNVVKEGGGGREVKKRGAQIKSGDVFIKALIDGESSRY